MTEDGKSQSGEGGSGGKGRTAAECNPWYVCLSLNAVALIVLGMLFQIQLVTLQRELNDLKRNSRTEKPRNLEKRSSWRRAEGLLDKAGIEAAHLQGTLPFQHIGKQGRIGPWAASATDPALISLRKRNTEIEISESGVYYVYAQVYYLTSEAHNSFQILSYNGTEDRKQHRNLATCSATGRSTIGEASCYTALARSFRSGDRLYLNQVEQNRIIHFTDGCSFFGVVLLRKNVTLRQKT